MSHDKCITQVGQSCLSLIVRSALILNYSLKGFQIIKDKRKKKREKKRESRKKALHAFEQTLCNVKQNVAYNSLTNVNSHFD